MNEVAIELLESLQENKDKYEELYNSDDTFKSDINVLIIRLEYMSEGNKKYPHDEVNYNYGRYFVYLKESSKTQDDDFWSIDAIDKITRYEISEDLKYFKIDNHVYDIKDKTLRK